MISLQNSSEYQYVVAVNGISPKKSSNGDSPNQGWHNVDGSPMFVGDSFSSFLSSNIVNGTSASGPAGIYLHHPSTQVFATPQATIPSPVHSPFSPRQVDRDSKSSEKQSLEDQLATDQRFDRENRYCPCGMPKHHPYLHNDIEISEQLLGVPTWDAFATL